MVEKGDELEVDLASGKIRNLSNGKDLQGAPTPDFVLGIAEAGGYLEFTRRKLVKAKHEAEVSKGRD